MRFAGRKAMNLELDDDEKAVLIELLADAIERDRVPPLSPHVKRLRAILAKIVISRAPVVPFPPPPDQARG